MYEEIYLGHFLLMQDPKAIKDLGDSAKMLLKVVLWSLDKDIAHTN